MNELKRIEEIQKNLGGIFSKSHKLWNIQIDGYDLDQLWELAQDNHEKMYYTLNSKLFKELILILRICKKSSWFFERERIQELNRINDLLNNLKNRLEE